ncbi:MAG: Uncharacterised protein [Halieaceae bacterium]|nr:MAG: Uncharacterised protein [Halieaceae bacterium]
MINEGNEQISRQGRQELNLKEPVPELMVYLQRRSQRSQKLSDGFAGKREIFNNDGFLRLGGVEHDEIKRVALMPDPKLCPHAEGVNGRGEYVWRRCSQCFERRPDLIDLCLE